MDSRQYVNAFIEEANEHLQALNQNLLELEKNSGDASVLAELFRSAHTLKGSSSTMGFNRMAHLTHEMENVLDVIQRKIVTVDSEMIDLLFKCIDAIESILNQVIDDGSEGYRTYEDIIEELSELTGSNPVELKTNVKLTTKTSAESLAASLAEGTRGTKPKEDDPKPSNDSKREMAHNNGSAIDRDGENDSDSVCGDDNEINIVVAELSSFAESFNDTEMNVIRNAISEEYSVFKVRIQLDKDCLMKAARAFIIFRAIEQNASIIKSEPGTEEIEDEHFDFEFTVTIITTVTGIQIYENLRNLSEIEDVQIIQIELPNTDKVSPDSENDTEHEDSLKEQPSLEAEEKHEPETAEKPENAEKEEQKTEAGDFTTRKSKANKTVRVDINRLDILLNLVSELIIQKTRLEGLTLSEQSQTFTETIEYLERISTNLHDVVMKVRMVPVENVFNRFPKMVRDISRRLSKEIELAMSGQETELDRTVIDELGEPLLHIIRNAIDHGIEDKEVRLQYGKSERGHIFLRAFQDGNNVVIEVQDDGCGINTEKVRMKAVETGRITADVANAMTRNEINQLVFLPSFSTSDSVTDISGRGVGMDVVKTKIESLGGVILMDSEETKGTRISIRLPLTLAMIQALLVIVGNEKYAIQLNAVHQIIKIPRDNVRVIRNQEVFIMRDMIVPVMRLASVLEVPDYENLDQKVTIVVVKRGGKFCGFIVDSIIGQQEIVQKPLGKFFQNIKVVTGATILGDGKVSLILDVNALTLSMSGQQDQMTGLQDSMHDFPDNLNEIEDGLSEQFGRVLESGERLTELQDLAREPHASQEQLSEPESIVSEHREQIPAGGTEQEMTMNPVE